LSGIDGKQEEEPLANKKLKGIFPFFHVLMFLEAIKVSEVKVGNGKK
jgi:hypothetical protein